MFFSLCYTRCKLSGLNHVRARVGYYIDVLVCQREGDKGNKWRRLWWWATREHRWKSSTMKVFHVILHPSFCMILRMRGRGGVWWDISRLFSIQYWYCLAMPTHWVPQIRRFWRPWNVFACFPRISLVFSHSLCLYLISLISNAGRVSSKPNTLTEPGWHSVPFHVSARKAGDIATQGHKCAREHQGRLFRLFLSSG